MRILTLILMVVYCNCDKNYNVQIEGNVNGYSSFKNEKVNVNVRNVTKTCEGSVFTTNNGKYTLSFNCLHTLPKEVTLFTTTDTLTINIIEKNKKIFITQKGNKYEVQFKKTRKKIVVEYDLQ